MQEYSNIPGWGVDADPKNEPTYPMRKRTGAEHKGYSWSRPPLQPNQTEVLHSNEGPDLTAVYGTVSPPSSLSGWLRRVAFKYSESSYAHWLPLMLADRVNCVEGIAGDVAKGRIPNFFKEAGWGAEWKYNRNGLISRVAMYLVLGLLAVFLVHRNRE